MSYEVMWLLKIDKKVLYL